LRYRVKDAIGSPIEGAELVVTGPRGLRFRAVADRAGVAELALPAGVELDVEISASCFRRHSAGCLLADAEALEREVVLEVGTMGEVVEMRPEIPAGPPALKAPAPPPAAKAKQRAWWRRWLGR
jgi:hypothetical protein